MKQYPSYNKIITNSKPPSPQEPLLQKGRHFRIIEHFEKKGNACHTLNSQGKVDFYLLLREDQDFEDLASSSEDIILKFSSKETIQLEICYKDTGFKGSFRFDLKQPLDKQSLISLIGTRTLNVYYINLLDENYVCLGLKTLQIPPMLIYDLWRFVLGQKTLSLPRFSKESIQDDRLPETMFLCKAWGFYLNYTALLKRIGNLEEAEEIVSRHILHLMARLQKSRRVKIENGLILIWVGRKIGLSKNGETVEFYSLYLNTPDCTGEKTKDDIAQLTERMLKELPEFEKMAWVSPLAEESVPLSLLYQGRLYRISLNNSFYAKGAELFRAHYLPAANYISYYEKILAAKKESQPETKVYDLLEIRKKKQ